MNLPLWYLIVLAQMGEGAPRIQNVAHHTSTSATEAARVAHDLLDHTPRMKCAAYVPTHSKHIKFGSNTVPGTYQVCF